MRRAAVPAALVLAFLASGASAQPDPWAARVRAYSDVPLGSFQGADCVTIAASKSVVWRLLVAPETVSTWLLVGIPGIVPRSASYAKGLTASKGDVLSLNVTTSEGPRRIELSVIALQPGEVLSFILKSDDADLLGAKVERLTISLFVEGRTDGTTDVTWVSHFDADSPFSALLSPTQASKRRARRLSALHLFEAMAEEAARLPYPPLHDLPDEPQPTSAPKRKK